MSGKWQGGKGSDPRPISDRKKFEDNWDRIFGENEKQNGDPFTVEEAHKHFGGVKRRKWILWVLCPGFVKSKNDGQTHYIHKKQLRQLYELKYLDYVLTEEEYSDRKGIRPDEVFVIKLYPRYEGDYAEHKAELLAKLERANDLE